MALKNQMDISILNYQKYLTSDKRKQDFLNKPVTIYEKFDGVKVNIIKIKDTGNYKEDFIVSYKTTIIYPDEFEHASKQIVKAESINNSQFLELFDMLKKAKKSDIPLNYEFFVEFTMKKPTLQHKYNKIGAILIGYGATSYSIKFGKILSKPREFKTENRQHYAKLFGFDYPKPIFSGRLIDFESGIKIKELNAIYSTYKNILNLNNIDDYISRIAEILLKLESSYGGSPEGFVLDYKDFYLKIQQPYQTDKNHRLKTKSKYMGTPEEETQYWDNVRLTALNILDNASLDGDINELLKRFSTDIRKVKLNFTHPVKTLFQIKDDIQVTLKNILIKKLKGNNNFLFLGKFRVLSIAHYRIIKEGLKKYDDGVICLVCSTKLKPFQDLRMKMLKECFPKVRIITHNTGNIGGIMAKCGMNINVVLCGKDRQDDYRMQLRTYPDVKVESFHRTSQDISATEIISKISDFEFFKASTPIEIHKFYDEIKEAYKSLEY